MSDYLPEEIMVRIFERLPTKSLIKFSCLSKRWKFLILSDPDFAKSHFQIASQQQTLTHRFLLKADSYPIESDLDSLEMEATGVRKKKMHTPFLNCSTGVRFRSFNGLVCLVFNCGRRRLYIWNPSTGVNKEFPWPPQLGHVDCFGFGYVSATDEYKVFVSVIARVDSVEFSILSLRASNDTYNWKKIEAPAPSTFPPRGRMYLDKDRNGIVAHEALHWLNVDDIVAFDLYTEEFQTMPLPLAHNNDGYYGCLGPSLGGCLCLMTWNHLGHSTEFWVMGEYGAANSWTRQFTWSMVNPSRLVVATETSVFVETIVNDDGPELMRINWVDDENKGEIYVGRKPTGFLDAIEYQETLLWLP